MHIPMFETASKVKQSSSVFFTHSHFFVLSVFSTCQSIVLYTRTSVHKIVLQLRAFIHW